VGQTIVLLSSALCAPDWSDHKERWSAPQSEQYWVKAPPLAAGGEKIEATLRPDAKKFCEKCKDERKNKPIVGMVIVRGLALHDEEYSGGDILDPDNGSVYRCRGNNRGDR